MWLRFGVDIGGTFTDVVCLNDKTGVAQIDKVLTTVEEPQNGVMAGLASLAERGARLDRAAEFAHATTLVTNLILEGKGGPTALITTAGFTDLIEIGREYRYDVYDLDIELPAPVISRPLRFGVPERVAYDGAVLTPLDEAAVRALAAPLRAGGVRAVAVAFLHAYANPDHERRVGDLLAELLPDVAVSLSHEVHPEPKEYERISTTALDAHVKPVVRRYLTDLVARLSAAGVGCEMSVMLSNGGAASVETVTRYPIQIIESGPAAGVEAAAFHARRLGLDPCLSFDMGGTTAKLCLIRDGVAARSKQFETNRVHRFKSGSGLPVAVPVFDLIEIGAGGGSIARLNDLGLLQIGPDSAGSEPGPACYGRGGVAPTITDADLTLGLLDAASFLGGSLALDPEAARGAIDRDVARPLDLSPEAAALGIHNLVNETMASAARVYCAEQGEAPMNLTLIAFGGAGPVHAVGLARRLGCRRVVVPPFPGVMSAFGLLVADRAFERRGAFRAVLDAEGFAAAVARARELEATARAHLPEEDGAVATWHAELRHVGQDYPLELRFSDGAGGVEALQAAFAGAYRRLYGRVDDDNAIEFASLRVQVTLPSAKPEAAVLPARRGAPYTSRPAVLGDTEAAIDVPVYRREDLGAGQGIAGPAIVEERESTTVLGTGDSLRVDPGGALLIEIGSVSVQPEDATRPEEYVDA